MRGRCRASRGPWGEGWDGTRCNVTGRGTTPVGAYPEGASPCGCQDMAGNVWEWTADWYDAGYYGRGPNREPPGPETGESRVVRGGAWLVNPDNARAAFRYDYVGFRLVCASPIL